MHRLTCITAVGVALVAAGCGQDELPVSAAGPDQSVQVPADPSPRGQIDGEPAAPKRCKRASRHLPGRSLAAAHAVSAEARCPLRVVDIDGRSLPVTEDYSASRINVRVDDGHVSEIVGLF